MILGEYIGLQAGGPGSGRKPTGGQLPKETKMLPEHTVDDKWLYGGCWHFGEALKQAIPEGTLVGVWGKENGFQHVGLKVGDKVVDPLGSQTAKEFAERWKRYGSEVKPIPEEYVKNQVDNNLDWATREDAKKSAGELLSWLRSEKTK